VQTSDGSGFAARPVIVAVPLNALGQIDFTPAPSEGKQLAIGLGQASRGIKIFIRARGEPTAPNSLRAGHPFGYLGTDWVNGDGSQLLIGFGADAELAGSDIANGWAGFIDGALESGLRAGAAAAAICR
jgi:monoamine oxidase